MKKSGTIHSVPILPVQGSPQACAEDPWRNHPRWNLRAMPAPPRLLRRSVARGGGMRKQGAEAPCPYSFTRIRLAISPTMPRRKASTTVTKMPPWMTVTQAPISAR